MVSAAGLAPAIARYQAGSVAATPRARGTRRTRWSAPLRPWTKPRGGDWRTRRELHPQPSRRQRGALRIELRILGTRNAESAKIRVSRSALGSGGKRWKRSSRRFRFVLRHRIYRAATGSLPEIGSGGGSCTRGGGAYEARPNLILPGGERRTRKTKRGKPKTIGVGVSLRVPGSEFRVWKWWSRRVTLPHRPACRAGALLVCHDPGRNSE